MTRRVLFVLCLTSFLAASADADWRQFRGTTGNAVTDGTIPVSWDVESGKNVAWKAKLPGRGPSSPIVVKGNVVVSCGSGVNQDRMHVVCFDAATGKQRWHRQFWATGRTLSHPQSGNAAPTPASDGERIFAFYSSNDLVCLDLDGNLQWYRGLAHDYPKAGNDVGMAASPLVVNGTVVAQVENQGDSFATGIDATTGEERWRVKRPAQANWSSPVALPAAGKRPAAVLLQSGNGLTAHEPASGRELWRFEAPSSGIPSPVTSADRIFFAARGITALKVGSESNAPEVAWEANKLNPSSSSPVVHNGLIYTLNRGGVLTCGDAESGKLNWQLRLGGTYWATPAIAGNRMLCINYDGEARVVELGGKKGKVVGESKLGQNVQGSPALAGNAAYIRTDSHLWKVAE